MQPTRRRRKNHGKNLTLGIDPAPCLWLDNGMTTNNTNTTATAAAFADMINEMINDRRNYAAANGFDATDDEIADHIKASLIRMMAR